jgi:hypothetical protein
VKPLSNFQKGHSSPRLILWLLLPALVWLPGNFVLANNPGGDTNGANIALIVTGTTIVLFNGIITATITKGDSAHDELAAHGYEPI